MPTDGCVEGTILAFLAGDLDEVAAAQFDAHLLVCDVCWSAVDQDRRGQLAGTSLREPAPAELRARLLCAIHTQRHPRRPSRLLAAAALTVVMALGAFTLVGKHRPPSDPASIGAVVHWARSPSALPVSSHQLLVWRTSTPSGSVVIAVSPGALPAPAGARSTQIGRNAVWVARRGPVRLLCVMAPLHGLLAGVVPETDLAAVARDYGLLG
jgi:hypothetical protein